MKKEISHSFNLLSIYYASGTGNTAVKKNKIPTFTD